MPQQHYLDTVSEELQDWVEVIVPSVIEGLLDGGKPPFAASVTQQQLADYYDSMFWNPDGTDNALGRALEERRLGTPLYARALALAMRRRGLSLAQRAAEQEPEAETQPVSAQPAGAY